MNQQQPQRTHKINPLPKKPTLLELADNFKSATVEWAKSGFPITDETDYEARHEICKGCEFWDCRAFNNIGRCNKCGCSGFKLYLATSRCPEKKWDSVHPTRPPE
tara:strand:- start:423 stop:737 length:315 start_codon:yes stop_codon:yes gene_type:complete